uniref:ATP synthase complex subunit 8 n=1 Tax=Harpactocrates apennicola TaxID=1110479 RepID=A0A516IME4_9ARAC|nr:ATP synthase F0 subunit 8 [Harpactocrates apennicola]QDP17920.1 ATP synthase F0 subunit 8 [Harpactocrates apennicola]
MPQLSPLPWVIYFFVSFVPLFMFIMLSEMISYQMEKGSGNSGLNMFLSW